MAPVPETPAAAGGAPPCLLRLYVSGNTPRSLRAVLDARAFCEERLAPGAYELEVIDVYREPERARAAGVVAAPTLVRERPAPFRRALGDLSDREAVAAALGLATDRGGAAPGGLPAGDGR